MPTLNEIDFIRDVLYSLLYRQDYTGKLDIIIADGGSIDGTLSIINEVKSNLPANVSLRVIHNSKRHIPVALNMAAKIARGDILLRLDGHTVPPADFISRSVDALASINGKAIVGGRWEIIPSISTPCARAIAIAVSHPIGIGNAAYRTYKQTIQNNHEGLLRVDTVPFGAYHKSLWEELGGYDENLLTSEDYDFILRARQIGCQVFMDPNLVLKYFSRSNLIELWEQYFRYGYWTIRLLAKHLKVPTLRKLAPLVLILSIVGLLLLKSSWALILVGSYLFSILLVSSIESLKRRCNPIYLSMAFLTLHWAYGLGNIVSLFTILVMGARNLCISTRRQTTHVPGKDE